MNAHEVISALLDDEPFEPQELESALSEADGRALLVDLVALRRVVRPDVVIPSPIRGPLAWGLARWVIAAATMLLALSGAYVLGAKRTPSDVSQAPAPTRVLETTVAWQDVP